MPYSTVADLPTGLTEMLTEPERHLYLTAYNAAEAEGKEDADRYAAGWAVVLDERSKIGNDFVNFVDLSGYQFTEGEPTWIHAMSVGTYEHPSYGKLKFDANTIKQYADNVNNNVRGIELDIDYDHKAKTDEAAGWVKKAEARSDGLWLAVEWTKDAVEKIKNKAYKYFSPEFVDKWKNPKTGVVHRNVLFGGGLTNRPFLKDLLPITLSETSTGGIDVVDPELLKALGLAEGADAAAVLAKVQELQSAATKPPATDDKNTGGGQLTEESPEMKSLREQIEQMHTALRLSEVAQQFNEIKSDKHAIAPVALDELKAIALAMPKELSDKMVAALKKVVTDGIVRLGETDAGGSGAAGDTDVIKQFSDLVDKKVADNKGMTYSEAVVEVSSENPELVNAYRDATYIKEGAK